MGQCTGEKESKSTSVMQKNMLQHKQPPIKLKKTDTMEKMSLN